MPLDVVTGPAMQTGALIAPVLNLAPSRMPQCELSSRQQLARLTDEHADRVASRLNELVIGAKEIGHEVHDHFVTVRLPERRDQLRVFPPLNDRWGA